MFYESLAFNEGGNDGFWRFQLRDRFGRWIKMGGSAMFEFRKPNDKNVYKAKGTFQGNIRRGWSIIRVGGGEQLPPGDYEIDSRYIESIKAIINTTSAKPETVDAPKSINPDVEKQAAEREMVASTVGDLEAGDIVQQSTPEALYGEINSVEHGDAESKINVTWSDGSNYDMTLPKDQKVKVWEPETVDIPSYKFKNSKTGWNYEDEHVVGTNPDNAPTDEEVDAVVTYVGKGYTQMNAAARGEGTGDSSFSEEEIEASIENLTNLIDRNPPLGTTALVYRGVYDSADMKWSEMEVGGEFVDNGFVSTSPNAATARSFGSVQLEIELGEDTKAIDISRTLDGTKAAAPEQEVILQRGTKFEVIAKTENGFRLRVVGSTEPRPIEKDDAEEKLRKALEGLGDYIPRDEPSPEIEEIQDTTPGGVTHTFGGKEFYFSPEELEKARYYISKNYRGAKDVTDEEGRAFNEEMRALTDYLRPGSTTDETLPAQREYMGKPIPVGELRHSAPPGRFEEIMQNGIRPKITDKVGSEKYSRRRFGVFLANDYTSTEAGQLAEVFRVKVPENDLRVDSGYTPYGENLYIERTINPEEIEHLGHIPAGAPDDAIEVKNAGLHDGRGPECTVCNPELAPAEPENVDAPKPKSRFEAPTDPAEIEALKAKAEEQKARVAEVEKEREERLKLKAEQEAKAAESYRMAHRPPGRSETKEEGVAASLDKIDEVFPEGILDPEKQQSLFRTGDAEADKETFDVINSIKGNPDAEVTIYRGVPDGVDAIGAGDWVTLSPSYAQHHVDANVPDGKVISKKVKASELFTNADSINEWGYDPEPETVDAGKVEEKAPEVPEATRVVDSQEAASELIEALVEKIGLTPTSPGSLAKDLKKNAAEVISNKMLSFGVTLDEMLLASESQNLRATGTNPAQPNILNNIKPDGELSVGSNYVVTLDNIRNAEVGPDTVMQELRNLNVLTYDQFGVPIITTLVGVDTRWKGKTLQEIQELIDSEPDIYQPSMVIIGSNKTEGFLARYAASNLIMNWAVTSNDNSTASLAIQKTAKNLFGLDSAADWDMSNSKREYVDADAEINKNAYEGFLRAQYEATQEFFAEQGVKAFKLFRGFTSKSKVETGYVDTTLRPLSSFSTKESQAAEFALPDNYDYGYLVEMMVPVEDILAIPGLGFGCYEENEVVVLGGKKSAWISSE